MSSTSAEASWASVWALYSERSSTFRAVFRNLAARGMRFEEEARLDLIHEFLLERAPRALATFRPDRGEMDGWLFVVFRRFVTGNLSRQRVSEERLTRFLAEGPHQLQATESTSDLAAARAAVAALPEEEQRAIAALLRPEGGSVRNVARELSISRWRAQHLLESALDRVRAALVPTTPTGTQPVSLASIRKALENSHGTDEPDGRS